MSHYPQNLSDPSLAEIAEILSLPSEKQAGALNDFFIVRTVTMRRIASAICRLQGRTSLDFFDEVYSIVLIEAMALVDKLRIKPEEFLKVRRYETKVKLLAETKVVEWMATEAGGAVASGMTGALRRTRVARQTEESLAAALGRAPSVEEIVLEANRRVAAIRKDPAKQGMIITEKDLNPPIADDGDISEMVDIADPSAPYGTDYDCVLSVDEGLGFVSALRDSLNELDDFTALVGHLWLDQYGPGWGPMRPREIVERINQENPDHEANIQKVVEAMEVIKGHSVVLLSRMLDISAERY